MNLKEKIQEAALQYAKSLLAFGMVKDNVIKDFIAGAEKTIELLSACGKFKRFFVNIHSTDQLSISFNRRDGAEYEVIQIEALAAANLKIKILEEELEKHKTKLREPMPIEGVNGYYVSKCGVILNRHGIILKQRKGRHGYMMVSLSTDGKGRSRNCTVHRLVALTHLPKIEGKNFVNHIDGNKLNNNVENLEWVTASENLKHSFDIGLRGGEKNKNSKLTNENVREIKLLLTDKTVNKSEIARKYGVSSTQIYSIAKGKIWKNVKI